MISSLCDSPPVIIVGGGPVGLFLSLLLSEYRVPYILLERQSVLQRFQHPQAHFLNTRTMELLRSCSGITAATFQSSTPRASDSLYDMILKHMPPVAHWQSFRYGASIYDCGNPLAEIVHPVQRPLQSNCDANGILLGSDTQSAKLNVKANEGHDLSPCAVGHLPQHTFGRILYDFSAQQCQIGGSGSQILYSTVVELIEFVQPSINPPRIRIVARDERGRKQVYFTDLVIAADGAHSTVRQQLWNGRNLQVKKGTNGEQPPQVEQHLINIHVQIPIEIAHQIHSKNNYAMLYSVYTPAVVAMVVCHTIGEYVIQIPYFPPYQTLEDDFNMSKVKVLLDSIFGFPSISQYMQIRSIAPWIMKSWIADHYYQLSSCSSDLDDSVSAGAVLVGDAAHVFPPAGGFGMNTGLQDVHNLAWKVAAYRSFSQTKGTSWKTAQWSLKHVLESYERERRAVALQNAALSVRNYERLLEVTKTFYLDAQHPALLCSLLDHSPLPLFARQHVFRSLLRTALYPLSWLNSNDTHVRSSRSSSPWFSYTNHIRTNLRRILHVGAGLPLLFPRYEIGFRYDPPMNAQIDGNVSNCSTGLPRKSMNSDTIPDIPYLAVGRLVPHVLVQVAADCESLFPRLKFIETSTKMNSSLVISSTDLPAQMTSPNDAGPHFVLLCIFDMVSTTNLASVDVCRCKLADRLGVPVALAVLSQEPRAISLPRDIGAPYLMLSECVGSQSFSFFQASGKHLRRPLAILIRPDGHIAGIVTSDECNSDFEAETGLPSMLDKLLHGVHDFF